jgi:S-adenosylmethionine/arginine decarboxylase-like enzyme
MKTRKNKKGKEEIQHHHLLLRVETVLCPEECDKEKMGTMIRQVVQDINMKPLGNQEVFYVSKPRYNEGLTAIQVIETSHIAFHFWKNPDRNILKGKGSKCLLQLDVYTCGTLNSKQIKTILTELSRFEPTHADITLLNRKWSLIVDKHDRYEEKNGSWASWINNRF